MRRTEVVSADIFTAAIVGDDDAVRRFVSADPGRATDNGGPRGWTPLTCLCFSKYLRLNPSRSADFARAATALLEAGDRANSEMLYGAAGIAHNPVLTRLLLDHGADPNNDETPYHAPETYDNAALKVLLESGKLNPESLDTMLLRKADWHDYDGVKLLLQSGANANRMTRFGYTALQQALRRDNDIAIVKLLLDHGADALLTNRRDGRSAVAMAARRGRGDVLDLLEARGVSVDLDGIDGFIATLARGRSAPPETLLDAGTLLAEFAGNGNTEGVRTLLDLGVPVDSLYSGDPYFDIAVNSTALHVAAWRAQHSTVNLLIEAGAAVDALDGAGRTPLMLAVRACVDSYWTHRRSPASVEALLRAGASTKGISLPSGYNEVDRLLAPRL